MALYGFASEEERDLFLHLISVSGVGPKVAIAILSGGTPRELLRAIAAGDSKRFQAVPGIGKRTAERVIVELREKVAGELEEAVPIAAERRGGRPAHARPRRPDAPRLHARRGREAARRRRRRDARGPDRLGPARRRRRAARPRRDEHRARPEHLSSPADAAAATRSPSRWPRSAWPAATTTSTARCARAGSPTSSTRSRSPAQLEVFIEAARRRGGAARPRPARRPAGPRQDLARAHHRRRARGAVRPDRRPGARAQGRHRRVPHRTGAGLGVLHRRDPPAQPGDRGDALPGDGGPPAARSCSARAPARGRSPSTCRRSRWSARPRAPACSRRRFATASASRHRLEHYDADDLAQIVHRSAEILEVEIEPGGERVIAERSRGTPRVANRLLKRVRDFAEVRGSGRRSRERGRGRGARPARGRRRRPRPPRPHDPRHDRGQVRAAARSACRRSPPRSTRSRTRSRTSTSPTCSSRA